jgi:hypothetical protein
MLNNQNNQSKTQVILDPSIGNYPQYKKQAESGCEIHSGAVGHATYSQQQLEPLVQPDEFNKAPSGAFKYERKPAALFSFCKSLLARSNSHHTHPEKSIH